MQNSEKKSSRGRKIVACSVVASLAVAFGWPTRGGDFLSGDDQRLILDHYLVNHPSMVNAGRLLITRHDDLYQPIPMLSLQLDYARAEPTTGRRFPVNASPFHATNILLHAINSILAMLLTARLIGCLRVGVLAGAMFACHPFALEAVAWISGRMMLLAAMFSMLTMLACLGRKPGRGVRPVGAVLAWLAAAASKILPTVPLAAIWLDYQRRRRGHRLIVGATPNREDACGSPLQHETGAVPRQDSSAPALTYALLILISVGGSFMAWDATRRAGFIEGAATERTTSLSVHALLSAGYYLRNYAWPMELAAWSPPPVGVTTTSLDALTALGALTVFVVLALLARRWNWAAFLGLVLFAILLAPFLVAGTARRFLAADRYMYLPILGLHMAVAAVAVSFWDRLARRMPRVHSGLLVGAPVVLLLLAWMTAAWRLAPTWADTIRRDRRVVAVYPDSEAAHAELAKAHNFQRDPDGALAVVSLARLQWPQSPRLAAAASEAYRLQDDLLAAIEEIRFALEGMPRHLHTRYRYGQLLDAVGRVDDARTQFEQILDTSPDYLPAALALARLYRANDQYDDAVSLYERTVDINPYHRDSRFELAELYLSHGEWVLAEKQLRLILAVDPKDGPARMNLAVSLTRQEKVDDALAIYDELLAIEPENSILRINRAAVLASSGRPEDAEAEFRAVLEQQPGNRDAVVGLHGVLQEQGHYEALPDLWRSRVEPAGADPLDRAWWMWSLALAGEFGALGRACSDPPNADKVSQSEFVSWACCWKMLLEADAAKFRECLGAPRYDSDHYHDRMEQSRMIILALRKLPDDFREYPIAFYALARAALHGGDFVLAEAAAQKLTARSDDPNWQAAADEILRVVAESHFIRSR